MYGVPKLRTTRHLPMATVFGIQTSRNPVYVSGALAVVYWPDILPLG